MSNKTKDWRLTDIKKYENTEKEIPFCLAALKYYSVDFKKTEKIIFFRNLQHQRSYFSWKIIALDSISEEDFNMSENN